MLSLVLLNLQNKVTFNTNPKIICYEENVVFNDLHVVCIILSDDVEFRCCSYLVGEWS